MEKVAKHTFLYDLLISPRYRIGRHALLILSLGIIAFNQTFFIYQENIHVLGPFLYLLGSGLFLGYTGGAYFIIFLLIPRYLLKKKYTAFFVFLSVCILFMLVIKLLGEYFAYSYLDLPHSRSSYLNHVALLDNVSYYITMLICVAGMSMTVLLKNWITEDQHINQLEKKQLQLEVEQLKDQVNPTLLFNVLNRTGVLAKSDPGKASQMILKLSHILRYQLYDGEREKVLLSAEIKFLDNYLSLQKLYADHLDYTIRSGKEINRIFIPPLLFIPFVQQAVEQINSFDKARNITVVFEITENHIEFICYCYSMVDFDFSRIRYRMEMLYPDRYELTVGKCESDEHNCRIRLMLKR